MKVLHCYAYAEDEPSCEVIGKLVAWQNENAEAAVKLALHPGFPENLRGYTRIQTNIRKRLSAAEAGIPMLVLADLDQRGCAPILRNDWLGPAVKNEPLPRRFWFRIAVREVESWLIADGDALARFLGISAPNLTASPDELDDPKRFLLNVIQKKCRKKRFREMLPTGNASIGSCYNLELCRFVTECWCPDRAALNSPSLNRAMLRLRQFE